MSPTAETNDPFAQLRELQPELRSDLQISRQLTKGEPVYVVYDPVSFRAHRLSLHDYRVVSLFTGRVTLQGIFNRLVQDGELGADNEQEFFSFVNRLDGLNLLSTSFQSSSDLYKRFSALADAERKARWKSWMFLTLPLANPDKFLDRSIRRFAFLFTTKAFVLWALGMIVAFTLVIMKWEQFVLPINSLLATQNLIFMAVAFLGLKVWHELGHGYACKHFGGRVPEMGCKLIVGMPLAYVDATSAWSFPQRRHRILVMLGGMYFESLVAIPAAVVWAFNPDTAVGSFAYQLIFMAGVATIFFNANPLMKYDGYFVLSDLIGIPNLRARASQAVNSLFKRRVLGLEVPQIESASDRAILLSYGISSSIYMMTVMISISALIAIRFQTIGLLLAGSQLLGMCIKSGKAFFGYLLRAQETEPVRGRARVVALAVGIGIPLVLLVVPIPTGVQIPGVLSAEQVSVVRVNTPGIVTSIDAQLGQAVVPQQPLLRLRNLEAESAKQETMLAAVGARKQAYFVSREDIASGTKLQYEADIQLAAANQAITDQSQLAVRSRTNGKLALLLPQESKGIFLKRGEPVATIVSGETLVRAWVDAQQLHSARLQVGETVNVRLAEQPGKNYVGRVLGVSPSIASEFQDLALTTLGEGDITADPTTGETTKPLFQVRIQIPELNSQDNMHNARAFVLAKRKYESIAGWAYRSTKKFINSLYTK